MHYHQSYLNCFDEKTITLKDVQNMQKQIFPIQAL